MVARMHMTIVITGEKMSIETFIHSYVFGALIMEVRYQERKGYHYGA